MASLPTLLSLAHLIGLALGLGCATAKLALLLRCQASLAFLPAYAAFARILTRLIVAGMALLTLSGIGWLLVGYPFTPLLGVKLVMVGTIFVLGPIIDNIVEPRFWNLAPAPGESASPAFVRIQRRYVLIEAVATGLFYVIVAMWVLA
jgi:hypothetical protein